MKTTVLQDTSNDVYDDLLDFALSGDSIFTGMTCADFLDGELYNPEIGKRGLGLHPEQRHAIDTMTRMIDGVFEYSTLIYSAPKKHGKTTVSGGILLWWGLQEANGYIQVVANDLKQADSRMFRVIDYTVKHHPQLKDVCKVKNYQITLPNGTVIEAIPVDPEGEAGANPTAIGFTEVWGMKSKKAELMWSETTLSPSRAGRSFKLVESYAGHTGESVVLERLYNSVVAPEYLIDPERELYANGGTVAYWCTRRIMPWQVGPLADTYYEQEASDKTEAEYKRVHNNEWASALNKFVPIQWWEACKGVLPAIQPREQCVIGLDAAVSGDHFAMVMVSRRKDIVYVRGVWEWIPPKGGKINYADVEAQLLLLLKQHRVLCVVYDPYQLHDMATRLGSKTWFEAFNQAGPRLIADKGLYDSIRAGTIMHDGNAILTSAIDNANAKEDGDGHKLRIVKRNQHLKIDPAVALSMAVHQARYLYIG